MIRVGAMEKVKSLKPLHIGLIGHMGKANSKRI